MYVTLKVTWPDGRTYDGGAMRAEVADDVQAVLRSQVSGLTFVVKPLFRGSTFKPLAARLAAVN